MLEPLNLSSLVLIVLVHGLEARFDDEIFLLEAVAVIGVVSTITVHREDQVALLLFI